MTGCYPIPARDLPPRSRSSGNPRHPGSGQRRHAPDDRAVDACVHDGFVAFKDLDESRVRPDFFLWQLHLAKALHQQSTAGAIFLNLTTKDIKALTIVVPPVDLQDQFVAHANRTRTFRSLIGDSAAQLDTLFASLEQRAFLGEL